MYKEEQFYRSISASIEVTEYLRIKDFIHGAVYCWCKNNQDEHDESRWFAARDLFGGENTNWKGTPLQALYEYHFIHNKERAVEMAGIDLGHILKKLLSEDIRFFDTKKNYVRFYKWIKD
jgi:hypothetical protein